MWERASRWWRDRYRKAGSAVLANGRSRRPRNSKYMRVCDIVTYTLRRCKQFLRTRGALSSSAGSDDADSGGIASTDQVRHLGNHLLGWRCRRASATSPTLGYSTRKQVLTGLRQSASVLVLCRSPSGAAL